MKSIQPRLKKLAIRFAKRTGRYADWAPGEHQTRQTDAVWFSGDLPPSAGSEMNQYRLVFAPPQALITHASNVIYTQQGMAWINGRLERRFSFQEIGLRQILESHGRAGRTLERGSILQSQTPCTYGDWVSEHVAALALAIESRQVVEPLILPDWWFAKPYVKRDLAILGVEGVGIGGPVLIKNATVVNKTRISHYWTPREVSAVIATMRIHKGQCGEGTALYLSRKGERGEGPKKREILNDVTEAAMEESGVRVVRTAGKSRDEYIALAGSAETVFADHGSAIYNMLHWQTKRVVELFSPDYWDSSFLFFAASQGIFDYHLCQVDANTTVQGLSQRVRSLMSQRVRSPARDPAG